MPKNTKKNNKKKGSRKVPNGTGLVPMALKMQVCSVTNPFCPEAVGARYPDDSNTKSVGWSVTNKPAIVSTDAAGKASWLFMTPPGATVVAGTVATDTVTYGPNMSTDFTVPTNVVRWRVTSWGFRISAVAPALTLQGMLRIRLFSPIGAGTLTSTSLTSNFADAVMDIPLHRILDKDLYIIPTPLGTNARLFNDLPASAAMATLQSYGWQSVQIGVDGAAVSVPTIQIASFYNYEFVFADGSSNTAFAQPPPPNSPIVRTVAASVSERIGNFVTSAGSAIDDRFVAKAGGLLSAMISGYMNPAGAARSALGNARPMAMIMD